MDIKYGDLIRGDIFTDNNGIRFEFVEWLDDILYYRSLNNSNTPTGDPDSAPHIGRDDSCTVEVSK